jgi:hypothetical protein
MMHNAKSSIPTGAKDGDLWMPRSAAKKDVQMKRAQGEAVLLPTTASGTESTEEK